MDKKDILLTGLCAIILCGGIFKSIQLLKKNDKQEVIEDEEMVYEDEQ